MAFKNYNISKKTLRYLTNIVKSNNFSHAYIFAGENHTDCLNLVREFVKAAYCISDDEEKPCGYCLPCQKIEHDNHEDVVYLKREGSIIKVLQIEELLKSLSVKPASSNRITAIIPEADKMNSHSQNKLLKTLEEPAPGYIVILVSEMPEKLLETIKSRCVSIRMESAGYGKENDMQTDAAVLVDKLLNNDPYFEITKFIDNIVTDKEHCPMFLDALETEFDNRLKYCIETGAVNYDTSFGISRIMGLIGDVRRDLSLNISVKYSMRNLIISIGDILADNR